MNTWLGFFVGLFFGFILPVTTFYIGRASGIRLGRVRQKAGE